MQAAILNVICGFSTSGRKSAGRWPASMTRPSRVLDYGCPPNSTTSGPFITSMSCGSRTGTVKSCRKPWRRPGFTLGIHYPIPLPYLNAYRHLGYTPKDFPQSLQVSGEILSLPMFPELTGEQVEQVARSISEAL